MHSPCVSPQADLCGVHLVQQTWDNRNTRLRDLSHPVGPRRNLETTNCKQIRAFLFFQEISQKCLEGYSIEWPMSWVSHTFPLSWRNPTIISLYESALRDVYHPKPHQPGLESP